MRKGSQLSLIKKEKSDYGGALSNTRAGRSKARPLAVRSTMHLVLRSSKAKGEWSFKKHAKTIRKIVDKFAGRHHVKIVSYVNVGNHLHLQIKLGHRTSYRPFIRAITAAIKMKVTGVSRWVKNANAQKFWDLRPFTRIVTSFTERISLRSYILVNFYESMGYNRRQARFLVEWERNSRHSSA